MSTFDGIINEFPHIRVDFFRASLGHPPPLACFLSHIHSDHLQGLESLRAPYVYCSSATRSLVLQLERYPNRINFARGVLETRKLDYKHLKTLLRPIALNCPTEIELGVRKKIRVTLFDANHCPGATMFLIEGDGKAVLYTGDVRAEPWWVNQLARNPILIPYTLGAKRIDRLYLDTTFAIKEDLYREFPSKAEGLNELLEQIKKYPPQTVFHLMAWTLGYEEVWQAMSALLYSQVHVDEYQCRLYGSLSISEPNVSSPEAPILNGFPFGNGKQGGCLTNKQTVRIHSCEPGTDCHATLSEDEKTVWIFPIIVRTSEGVAIPEVGAGGSGSDLYQIAELNTADTVAMNKLEELCLKLIDNPESRRTALRKLSAAKDSRMMKLSLEGLKHDSQGLSSVQDLVSLLATTDAQQTSAVEASGTGRAEMKVRDGGLSNIIHFPYSRHSSYSELRHLISTLRPKDIYPCTVDLRTWTEERSMKNLFGDLCSGQEFAHDQMMGRYALSRQSTGMETRKRKREDEENVAVASDIESTKSPSYMTEGSRNRNPVPKEELLVNDQGIGEIDARDSGFFLIKEESPDRPVRVDPRIPTAASPPSYDDLPPIQVKSANDYIPGAELPNSSCSPSPPVSPNTRLRNIKAAYIRLKQPQPQPPPPKGSYRCLPYPRTDIPAESSSLPSSPQPSELLQVSSPLTLSSSYFDSQHTERQSPGPGSPTTVTATITTKPSTTDQAVSARKAAYRAAKSTLTDGTAGNVGGSSWEFFATRSGGNSHTEAEVEL